MNTRIYINGCYTCGKMAAYVNKVRRRFPDVKIYNTKYREDRRSEHEYYLTQSGIGTSSYRAIVVQDGIITLLSEWNPQA